MQDFVSTRSSLLDGKMALRFFLLPYQFGFISFSSGGITYQDYLYMVHERHITPIFFNGLGKGKLTHISPLITKSCEPWSIVSRGTDPPLGPQKERNTAFHNQNYGRCPEGR